MTKTGPKAGRDDSVLVVLRNTAGQANVQDEAHIRPAQGSMRKLLEALSQQICIQIMHAFLIHKVYMHAACMLCTMYSTYGS